MTSAASFASRSVADWQAKMLRTAPNDAESADWVRARLYTEVPS